MFLDCRDYFQCCMRFGVYEPEVAFLISILLGQGDIFVDVGAHLGYFSFIAAGQVGGNGEVHAFEPDPVPYAYLQQAVRLNSLEQNVFVNQAAVSDKPGEIEFNLSERSGWSTGVGQTELSIRGRTSVPATTLDDYVKKKNVDINRIKLVKIDTEGWEVYALRGMERLLGGSPSPYILCEHNPFRLKSLHFTLEDILGILSRYGYKGYAILRWRAFPFRSLLQFLTGTRVWALPVERLAREQACDILFCRDKAPGCLKVLPNLSDRCDGAASRSAAIHEG